MSELLTIPPPHPPTPRSITEITMMAEVQPFYSASPLRLCHLVQSMAICAKPCSKARPAGNPLCHLRLLLCAVCAVPPSWFFVARIRKHLRRFMLCACEPAKSFQGRACDLACGRLRAFHPCCADTISHSGGARLGDYFAERAIRPPL